MVVLAAPPTAADWQRLSGLVLYVGGDYAEAVNEEEAAEVAEQRRMIGEAVAALEAMGTAGDPYRAQLASLRSRIDQGADPEGVTADCRTFAARILREQKLQAGPNTTPGDGTALWAERCAACHGISGDAQTPAAAALTPHPRNFHDADNMIWMTPYRAFIASTFGVRGTAMVPFAALSDDERWALAFHVFTLHQLACDHDPPVVPLNELAQSTDRELAAKYGLAEVPCLRRRHPVERPPYWVAAPVCLLVGAAVWWSMRRR